jgi:hypothetical protein
LRTPDYFGQVLRTPKSGQYPSFEYAGSLFSDREQQ